MQAWLQNLVPQHLLSRTMGRLAECRYRPLKNWAIKRFIRAYGVDMSEALEPDYTQYANFNEFFTRYLKPEARPLAADPNAIISPVDGGISELGKIHHNKLIQAKGQLYDLPHLLGGDTKLARYFSQGHFLTAYLSPKDYHRVHMPVTGRLVRMIYVPGRLFSVNEASVNSVPKLFARNERVICIFETTRGPMAMILVGAMIVGSIVTGWAGKIAPGNLRKVQCWDYRAQNIVLERGEELGYFRLGSTTITLFGPGQMHWLSELESGRPLRMGQAVGHYEAQQVLQVSAAAEVSTREPVERKVKRDRGRMLPDSGEKYQVERDEVSDDLLLEQAKERREKGQNAIAQADRELKVIAENTGKGAGWESHPFLESSVQFSSSTDNKVSPDTVNNPDAQIASQDYTYNPQLGFSKQSSPSAPPPQFQP